MRATKATIDYFYIVGKCEILQFLKHSFSKAII